MIQGVTIIAEVKTQSPTGWKSDRTWEELFDVAVQYGDMLSIHTDARWGGSFELVRRAKDMTRKPILAKGIHESDDHIQHAVDMGADWVLCVGRMPSKHLEQCMIEPNTLEGLMRVPEEIRAVWNARDLKTFGTKSVTFDEARAVRKGWLCQASFISTPADIRPGADAILIGTKLTEFVQTL